MGDRYSSQQLTKRRMRLHNIDKQLGLLSLMMLLQAVVVVTLLSGWVQSADSSNTSSSSSSSSSTNTATVEITGTNRDQFTYGETIRGENGTSNLYGPEDWDEIDCTNIDICLGFPDKYKNSQGWKIDETNHCMWCPFDGDDNCGNHHNSPTNLERSRAIVGGDNYNECVDPHWMEYRDSSCTFEELREKNAFTIERHSVRITQPVNWDKYMSNSTVFQIDCIEQQADRARRWGIIDFPRGYSDWYYLSHIDFKVPSEHAQEGTKYDGEIQLHHFYSVTPEVAGVHNQAGTVAIFMKVYDQIEDWPELNKIICAWREAEDKVRSDCGLPSVQPPYTGCTQYNRGAPDSNATISTQGARRSLNEDTETTTTNSKQYIPAKSIMDHLADHLYQQTFGKHEPKEIIIDHHNSSVDMEDFDWDAFIAEQYKQDEMHKNKNHRELLNYKHVPWFNYFPMIKVRTEYYFRYEGSQTIPPCYGKFIPNGDRQQTIAWRVMKDPILVTQRQIDEIHRLLKHRIAPKGDPLRSCKPDTAAAPDPGGDKNKVTVARPLQSMSTPHFTTFCECTNWKSKWIEDNEWCKNWKQDNSTQKSRYYDHPYNFQSSTF